MKCVFFWLCLRNHTREEILGVKSFPVGKVKEEVEQEETTSSPYKCPICYKTLLTQHQLESHVAMHTDSSFPCHICGKVVYIGLNLYKKTKLSLHLITHYAIRCMREWIYIYIYIYTECLLDLGTSWEFIYIYKVKLSP
jgi:hypothetical protein